MVGLLCAALALSVPVSRDVSFPGFEGITLKGTLVLPEGARVGVVLLPGSGPTDRDGNSAAFGLKTDLLKQIAESLATSGIASLRFDKRATQTYKAIWPKGLKEMDHFFRFESFVGDATAAVGYLRTVKGIQAKHVGVVGHSEGALIATVMSAQLAHTPRALAALGLLSGTGRPMGEVIMEQLRTKLPQQLPADQVPRYLDYAERALEAARQQKPFPPNPPMGLGGMFNPTVQSIIHSYVTIDPIETALRYPGPVIVVNGEYDNQVSLERDGKPMAIALQSRKQGKVVLVIAPKASHNLKAATSMKDDAFIGPVVSPVLPRLTVFLKANL